MATTTEPFRCMACGHEYQEEVEQGEDRERSCPKCRSNSIRHMKSEASPAKEISQSTLGPQRPRSHDDG